MKWIIIFLVLIPFGLIQNSYSQRPGKKIIITGRVLDINNKPVKNVMFFVDKVKMNSASNANGEYRIKVKGDAKKIVAFSYFNGTKEEEINGKNVVNFTLDGTANKSTSPGLVEKETINAGYGETSKGSLTMPVNKLKGNKSRYESYNNVYEMLNGEVPGVEVSGTSIKIRNATSFQLSTQPLFVVDGQIVDRIDDIVPAHVKSIEVLKGPAASVYGARGGNGVIIITLIGGNDK